MLAPLGLQGVVRAVCPNLAKSKLQCVPCDFPARLSSETLRKPEVQCDACSATCDGNFL